MSPTSYNVPASSTSISLTPPVPISLTLASANPFPIFSTLTTSLSECNIPSLTTVVVEKTEPTVNPTVTSLVRDIAVIFSHHCKMFL